MDFHVHSQRLAGFRQAMEAAGLPAGDGAFRPTEFSMSGGYELALSVLADPRTRPTAVVAGSDEVAIGTIVAARQLGITVPAQLSVVGIDGHELAPMFGLTTLAQDPGAQGTSAVELVMTELNDGREHPGLARGIPIRCGWKSARARRPRCQPVAGFEELGRRSEKSADRALRGQTLRAPERRRTRLIPTSTRPNCRNPSPANVGVIVLAPVYASVGRSHRDEDTSSPTGRQGLRQHW